MRRTPVVIALALVSSALFVAVPQERSLPFDDGGWAVSGPAIRQERGERGQ
jgi:hypothetical protein